MICQESQAMQNTYLDGELDFTRTLEMEKHLGNCQTCLRTYDHLRLLQVAMRSEALRFQAPEGFEKRLRTAVRRESRSGLHQFRWRWLIASVSIAAVVLIAFAWALTSRTSADDLVANEIVGSHVRSMMVNHLTDVASTDQHTVKPWFEGKLDFSPPVKDLATQGFPIIGGRLDYISNRPVAALVYQRRQHFINVFIWPASASDTKMTAQVRQGYNLIHWTSAGMTYWVVSDLNLSELQQFAQELVGS